MPAFSSDDFSIDYDIGQYILSADAIFQITPGFTQYTENKDSILKIAPRFSSYNDTTFMVEANWISIHYPIPREQLFLVTPNFTVGTDPYYTPGTVRDILINLLKLLKDSWSLSGDLSNTQVAFSTGWYNQNIQLPQITITPLSSIKHVLTTGDTPLYQYLDKVHIDIWVRPKQDSAQSLGWAKNAEYQMRREVERILRSGSRIGSHYNNEEFIYMSKRRLLDEMDKRPPILRTTIEVVDNKFRETVSDD